MRKNIIKFQKFITIYLEKVKSAYQTGGVILVLKRTYHLLDIYFFSKKNNENDYISWITLYEKDINYEQSNYFDNPTISQPLISILMPTFNGRIDWLCQAIESVQSQIYTNWELCIADDASTDLKVKTILQEYASRDKRIRLIFRTENGHISFASNSALSIASGDWIGCLDHDDRLHETALYWVAKAIITNPQVELIYSDEDKLTSNNLRLAPYFKPDWNRELFYSHNYLCHLCVYRKELLKRLEGFRVGFEGAQDYDLALRATEVLKNEQIYHIPKILYHWRIHAGSTAQSADAKPYAMLAGERALNSHFKRRKINATARLNNHGYRIYYDVPKEQPKVSLIIPTRNGYSYLKKCINSILNITSYKNFEIIIIDNGTNETQTLEFLKGLKSNSKIKIIPINMPFNYSALNNIGAASANGEIIGLINNDIEIIENNWLTEMVSIVLRSDVGAVGPKLLYPNNLIQHAGVVIGIGGWAGHAHKGFSRKSNGYAGRLSLASEFSAVTGACLLVKKSMYEEVGGLDEINLQVACNDVDFCLKLREKGYKNIYTPFVEIYHHESATRGYEEGSEKAQRFENEVNFMKKKWPDYFKADPMYSPNLTLSREDFSLARPPRL